jgi:hypothetical protein
MTAVASVETSRRREVLPPADGLRELASRVRRLGICGRTTPELTLLEKEQVAFELMRLARTLERPA